MAMITSDLWRCFHPWVQRHLASCKQLVRCIGLPWLGQREPVKNGTKFHRSCLEARCKWIDMDRYIMICQSFGKVDENLRVTDELHHFHNQGDFLGLPLGYPRLFSRKMWIYIPQIDSKCHKVMLKLSNLFLGTLFSEPCGCISILSDDLLGAGSLWWPSGELLRIATAGWATGEVWRTHTLRGFIVWSPSSMVPKMCKFPQTMVSLWWFYVILRYCHDTDSLLH